MDNEFVDEEQEEKAPAPKRRAPSAPKKKPGIKLYSGSQFSKIMLLLLVNITLLVLGIIILNFLEIIDLQPYVDKYLSFKRMPVDTDAEKKRELEDLERKLKYAQDRFRKGEKSLELEILKYKAQIAEMKKFLEEQALKKEKDDYEKRLTDNKRLNLFKVVADLYNMPPEKAVERLNLMTIEEAAELLEAHEVWCTENEKGSLRAYYLQLMPAERASEILRQIRLKPPEEIQAL